MTDNKSFKFSKTAQEKLYDFSKKIASGMTAVSGVGKAAIKAYAEHEQEEAEKKKLENQFEKPAIHEVVEKIIIERDKKVNGLIFGEIQQIAKENGIDTKIVVNEKAIISALEKQMPKKPTPHKVDVDAILIGTGYWRKGTTVYICPNCGGFISRTYKHCGDCGQALDWGDSK